MDFKPTSRGQVPSHTSPLELAAPTTTTTPGLASDTESRTSKKRKAEQVSPPQRVSLRQGGMKFQACDLCRTKKARCRGGGGGGGTPSSCACGQDGKANCTFQKILGPGKAGEKTGRKQPHRKGSLDRMAERISRMEAMLRQRGFLRDDPLDCPQKDKFKERDFDESSDEIAVDSVPSLCGTGMDSTIQTGLTVTGSNMEPPPLPDKDGGRGRVEMWLSGVPPFTKFETAFETGGEGIGYDG